MKQILSVALALAVAGTFLGCDRGDNNAGTGGTSAGSGSSSSGAGGTAPGQPKRSAPSGGSGGTKY